MRNDVPSNGFLWIRIEHRARSAIDLCYDLIGDHDSDAEFVSQALQRAHKFREVCLARGELAAAGKVSAVERGGAVDDEEGEARFTHHVRGLVEEL